LRKIILMLTVLTVIAIFSISFSSNLRLAEAQNSYEIEHLNHTISLMSNGYVLLNDTIRISGQGPNDFFFGLPYRFGSYVVWYNAFDANKTSTTFPVTVNEPFENRSGFYTLKVSFPSGMPQTVGVQILFSNRLVFQQSQNATLYTMIFPAFPCLTETVGTCNSSIVLPADDQYISGAISNTTYNQVNLPPLAYNVSTITFQTSGDEMQVFDIDDLTRQVTINEHGDILCFDSYSITNKASSTITSIQVLLPPNASDVTAQDQFGRTMANPTLLALTGALYDINLTSATARPLTFDEPTQFTVAYHLPSEAYIERQDGSNSYRLDMALFRDIDYYANATSVTFIMPEGADLQTFGGDLSGVSYGITKDVFQERLTLGKDSISFLDSFDIAVSYTYNSLWSSFRPTTWAIVLSIIGCVVIIVIRRPKGLTALSIPTAATRLRPDYLKSFLNSYEEKMKIMAEMDSLEEKARKGRIPRQRYKIQRKTLETRYDTLSKGLVEYKENLRAAGGHYASLMRELEVTEIELDDVETNLKSIDARHNRGELPLEGYRKLLGDYERRKEKAETTIDGILLRLREEIH
jgi:hypothetical protein